MVVKKARPKRATLQDIAREAGVSITTVSYVLNGTGAVGAEMSKRIRATAKRMNYRANHSAKATRTGKTRTIGLILPDLTNPFFPLLAQSIQQSANEADYAVFLVDACNSVEGERAGAQDLLARGTDGIIWCPTSGNDGLSDLRDEIPIVVVDRPMPDYDSVAADCYEGARQLADYLIEMGHAHVGVVAGPMAIPSARLRCEGFVDRFRKAASVDWTVENPFSIQLTDQTRASLKSSCSSAIVCGNDLIALGVMRFLHESGLRIPDDVSVVGFDDISWASFTTPNLTTVRQPFAALGKRAFELLAQRMDGDDSPRALLRLDMSIAKRDSVRPL
ncbi:LacI family DNA-binding transcriptional regulator [Sphingomonas flavalba]|uniref:LacI family DNA-binding transcriptional regulator n=1 Tax=Sphingomonas flavalba TaxID=2559804 RepID=UPI0039E11768